MFLCQKLIVHFTIAADLYISVFIHTYIHINSTHINVFVKGTIQKHAEVLILQEQFKAQSHLAEEKSCLHISAFHSDFWQTVLYNGDIYDKLSL